MKQSSFLLSLGLLVIIALSCSRKPVDSKVITKRIQYDVNIKSPDPDLEWWVQNIEGESRELLVKDIIDKASQGKVKAYDYLSNRPLSVKDINMILHKTDSISMERDDAPGELFDTVIFQNLDQRNITRLRFLEEWSMDEKTMVLTKKVLGMCPLIDVYAANGDLKGYKALFWVFFDEEYPGKLQSAK